MFTAASPAVHRIPFDPHETRIDGEPAPSAAGVAGRERHLTPDWSSTVVFITHDDSDGFYDRVYSGIHNPSNTSGVATPPGPQDFLTGTGLCGSGKRLADEQGRCGYGPRLPLPVISPRAKPGHIGQSLTDLTSIIRFVEDHWGLPRIRGSHDSIAGSLNSTFGFGQAPNPALILDPTTGQPAT